MTYEKDLKYLFSLDGYGMRFGLERIDAMLKKLEDPQDKIKNIIHVAGTNGKGSVCAMIAQVLVEAGFKVGTFTSPFVVDFRERIQINNEYIPKKEIVRLIHLIKSKNQFVTFFEFVTAMGFQYYYENNVDFVVLETGLGGRLDATNVVDSNIQVITSIDLEHTDILGERLDGIAKEKGGIIKDNANVFVHKDCNSLDIIKEECDKKDANLTLADDTEYKLSLKGEFQKSNAGIVVEIAIFLKINEKFIKKGLENTKWPGRLEWFGNILLDCAHNPAAIEKMSKYIESLDYSKLIIVFGVLDDKNYKIMLRKLPKCDTLILTKPKTKRALDPDKISIEGIVIEDVKEAIKHAQSISNDDDLILVTGSCYVVSEVRELLEKINI